MNDTRKHLLLSNRVHQFIFSKPELARGPPIVRKISLQTRHSFFFPSRALCCLVYFLSFSPLLIVRKLVSSVPLSLYSSRSPPHPIPNYVCCHGDSLHKGLTSYIYCTCMTENIPPNNAAESRAPELAFCFKHDSTSVLHAGGVGFMNSPIKVRSCAPRLYARTSELGKPARLSSRLVHLFGRFPVQISVSLLALLTYEFLVFLRSRS